MPLLSYIMQLLRTFAQRVYWAYQYKFPYALRSISYKKSFEQWVRVKMQNEQLPPHREDPIILKLDTPEFHSIFTPELNFLSDLFKKYNYELRVAGGAVRDLLMNIKPKDLDFATNATPTQMKEMFTKEEIRMINMNGEKHGTITSRINEKENFEITTLRIDVITDGRHAEVVFTNDWKRDAVRRDLTINSMYLDFDGNVYDYFYGYDDLQKRRIAFVGDAEKRIQEDFLRILRYFRFYGRITEKPDNHDAETLNVIKKNINGLERIAGERIWSEWKRILMGNFNEELTLTMLECDIAEYVGLPKEPNVDSFRKVCATATANNFELQPITFVAAMLRDEKEAMNLHQRLKLSAVERDLALFIVRHRDRKPCEAPLKPYQWLVLCADGRKLQVHGYICEVLKYRGDVELLKRFAEWKPPRFPVNGYDLKPLLPHPKLTKNVTLKLQQIWMDEDFKTEQKELLQQVPRILDEMGEQVK